MMILIPLCLVAVMMSKRCVVRIAVYKIWGKLNNPFDPFNWPPCTLMSASEYIAYNLMFIYTYKLKFQF